MQVLDLVQEFLLFELKFRHYPDSLTSLLVQLVFKNLILGLMLMEQSGHLLVLPQELVVLSKHTFHLILQFRKFFALSFQQCILFLKH